METSDRHVASHVFNIAVLVVGAGALAWMMHRLGVAGAERALDTARGWLALIIALELASTLCEAGAIHQFMRPEARMVSFWRVLAAQLSGVAINSLTPGGKLGEATKVTMLVGHMPRARAVSSIVLFNLASLYLSIAVLLIGVPLTAMLIDLPGDLAVIVWIATGVMVVATIGIAWLVHRGAVATILEGGVSLRILSRARADDWKGKLAGIDAHLRALHGDRSPGDTAGFALVALSRVLSWVGTIVLLHAVDLPLHVSLIVGVLSVGVLIGWLSAIVPLGVGVAEGGNFALYGLLGATASTGLIVAMISRLRAIVIALIGLAVMAAMHTATRIALARRRARIRAALASAHTLG